MVVATHLKSFQALELAVRLGSLKAAADELAITPAAVGQRVKALETYLGIDLLVRGRSGLKPTPALAAALSHLSAAFRDLDQVTALLDMQRGQEIHIAATPDFADLWLKPRLVHFANRHPNVTFSINGEGGAPARVGRLDCEIAFGMPRAGAGDDLLFRDYVAPIGSPENVQRLSRIPRRERLEGFPLLHLDFYKDDPAHRGWSHWIAANELRRTSPERGIRFRRIASVLEAVHADAGLTLCGLGLLSGQIDGKTIALPFGLAGGAWTAHAFEARFRAESLHRPPVRRFREWLVKEAQETRRWLERKTRRAH